MNKNNLPNNLYALRRKAGLSQEELAEKLGVSRQAVSKWERGEAYPDTENLIVISEMFSVTIDDLLKSDNISADDSDTTKDDATSSSDSSYFHISMNDDVKVNLNGEITVDDEDGRVKVGFSDSGIVVDSNDGVRINLGKNGIVIRDNDLDDDNEDDENDEKRGLSTFSVWYKLPYPIIVSIAFLAIGLFSGGWYWAWTLFLTIPIYYPLLDSIQKKRATEFPYTIIILFIYLLFGMLNEAWHPWWIIFLTVPIYYPIAAEIDKRVRRK